MRLVLCLALVIAPSKCAQHSSPATNPQRSSTPEAQRAATSLDLTNASDGELQQHVGELVTMRGKFSLRGKIAPFILVSGRPIYLEPGGSFSWGEDYAKLEGQDVRVTGTLRFVHYPAPSPQALPVGRASDHFYFEAEKAQIELVRS
jgi:hypothetical protein